MLPPNTRAWHLKIKLVDLVGGLFKTFIVYLQPIRKAVSELQIIYIYICNVIFCTVGTMPNYMKGHIVMDG
jgi:hypothetical protein